MLHDASRAFGAEHTTVDGVIAVALDVFYFFAFHVDVDPTATGAHVTGGFADFVRDLGRRVQFRLYVFVHGVLRS